MNTEKRSFLERGFWIKKVTFWIQMLIGNFENNNAMVTHKSSESSFLGRHTHTQNREILTLRGMVKFTFVFLKNMHKYVLVKSCIFCSKLQYSDDHHFVHKKSARTYWGNFVFYIQKLVIWTKWCIFYVFSLVLHFFRILLKKCNCNLKT